MHCTFCPCSKTPLVINLAIYRFQYYQKTRLCRSWLLKIEWPWGNIKTISSQNRHRIKHFSHTSKIDCLSRSAITMTILNVKPVSFSMNCSGLWTTPTLHEARQQFSHLPNITSLMGNMLTLKPKQGWVW